MGEAIPQIPRHREKGVRVRKRDCSLTWSRQSLLPTRQLDPSFLQLRGLQLQSGFYPVHYYCLVSLDFQLWTYTPNSQMEHSLWLPVSPFPTRFGEVSRARVAEAKSAVCALRQGHGYCRMVSGISITGSRKNTTKHPQRSPTNIITNGQMTRISEGSEPAWQKMEVWNFKPQFCFVYINTQADKLKRK